MCSDQGQGWKRQKIEISSQLIRRLPHGRRQRGWCGVSAGRQNRSLRYFRLKTGNVSKQTQTSTHDDLGMSSCSDCSVTTAFITTSFHLMHKIRLLIVYMESPKFRPFGCGHCPCVCSHVRRCIKVGIWSAKPGTFSVAGLCRFVVCFGTSVPWKYSLPFSLAFHSHRVFPLLFQTDSTLWMSALFMRTCHSPFLPAQCGAQDW